MIYADIKSRIPPAQCPSGLSSHLRALWVLLERSWNINLSERPSAALLLYDIGRLESSDEGQSFPEYNEFFSPTTNSSAVRHHILTLPLPQRTHNPGERGRRNEMKLRDAFTPASTNPDPALRLFLDTIFRCSFYEDDRLEPLFGTEEAEQLLVQVRNCFPKDPRFHPRLWSDNEARYTQSIFMLFTKDKRCLICGVERTRTYRVLGHVRSELGHRPYHCTCENCSRSAKYVFPPVFLVEIKSSLKLLLALSSSPVPAWWTPI